MKRTFITLLCLCAVHIVAAQGIVFLDQPKWEEVIKEASTQDKLIFMDCYTTWCGPCKKLAKDVFPQPEVGDFFNANFINVKYDMEKDEGVELREQYKSFIVGFPTLLLIDKNGIVVHQMAGYQEPEALIAGMKAGQEGKSLYVMKSRYETGERDVDFLTDYVSVLHGAFLKDEIEKVVVAYMESLPADSLFSEKNWALVNEYIKDPYSPQFEYTLRNVTKLFYNKKVNGYKLERQLSGALDRAVGEIVNLKTDQEENMLPLNSNQTKIAELKKLIDIANLKRAESQRAFLKLHELKLNGEWEQVLDYMNHYSQIEALGYGNRFAVETIRYTAVNTTDKAILKQCLAIMNDIQHAEDSSKRGGNYHHVLAILYRALGDEANAEKFRAIYDEYRKKIEAEWKAMLKAPDN